VKRIPLRQPRPQPQRHHNADFERGITHGIAIAMLSAGLSELRVEGREHDRSIMNDIQNRQAGASASIKITPAMVERGVDVLLNSGALHRHEPSRGPLRLLVREILTAALSA
jgi:hypothetical protein